VGETVTHFSVGLSVGFGTVIGAFITAYAAIKLDWIPQAGASGASGASGVPASPDLKPLARKLMAVLRMSATYDPAGGTLQQAMASIREKMAAASRQRPSTIQLLFCFMRRVKEVLAGGSRRLGPRPAPAGELGL
jgi:hypothetical protein